MSNIEPQRRAPDFIRKAAHALAKMVTEVKAVDPNAHSHTVNGRHVVILLGQEVSSGHSSEQAWRAARQLAKGLTRPVEPYVCLWCPPDEEPQPAPAKPKRASRSKSEPPADKSAPKTASKASKPKKGEA